MMRIFNFCLLLCFFTNCTNAYAGENKWTYNQYTDPMTDKVISSFASLEGKRFSVETKKSVNFTTIFISVYDPRNPFYSKELDIKVSLMIPNLSESPQKNKADITACNNSSKILHKFENYIYKECILFIRFNNEKAEYTKFYFVNDDETQSQILFPIDQEAFLKKLYSANKILIQVNYSTQPMYIYELYPTEKLNPANRN